MAPEIPRIEPAPASFGNASPDDFGAQIAQGTEAQGRVIGQIGQLADQLKTADQNARLARATSSAAVKLEQLRVQLSMDPDFATHQQRYQNGSQQIVDEELEASGLLPGQYSELYRERIRPIQGRNAIDVAEGVQRKRIDAARANGDAAGRQLSATTAQALERGDAPLAKNSRDTYFDYIESQVKAGLYTREQAYKAERDFDVTVDRGRIAHGLNEDAFTTWTRLRNPDDPLGKALPPAELEQHVRQAERRFYQEQRIQRQQTTFDQHQQDRAKKDRAEAIGKQLDDQIAQGNFGPAAALLEQGKTDLSQHDYRYYRDHIASRASPLAAPVRTNPQTYLTLSHAIAQGQDVSDDIDTAYTSNQLTQANRAQLMKANNDKRFGDSERRITTDIRALIKEAYRKGHSGAIHVAEIQAAEGEVRNAWHDFKQQNPHATHADAVAKQQELIGGVATRYGLSWPPGVQRPPSSTGGAPPTAPSAAPGGPQGALPDLNAIDAEIARRKAMSGVQ